MTSARRGSGWSAAPISPPMTCVAASERELPSTLPFTVKARPPLVICSATLDSRRRRPPRRVRRRWSRSHSCTRLREASERSTRPAPIGLCRQAAVGPLAQTSATTAAAAPAARPPAPARFLAAPDGDEQRRDRERREQEGRRRPSVPGAREERKKPEAAGERPERWRPRCSRRRPGRRARRPSRGRARAARSESETGTPPRRRPETRRARRRPSSRTRSCRRRPRRPDADGRRGSQRESPRPYGTASRAASSAQVAAKPASVPGRARLERASDPNADAERARRRG